MPHKRHRKAPAGPMKQIADNQHPLPEGSRIRNVAALDQEKVYWGPDRSTCAPAAPFARGTIQRCFPSGVLKDALSPGASPLSAHGSSNSCRRRHAPELQPGMQRPSDFLGWSPFRPESRTRTTTRTRTKSCPSPAILLDGSQEGGNVFLSLDLPNAPDPASGFD
jgi:hypothetical protein